MCGIAGIFAYREAAPPVSAGELLRIREHTITRGPDDAGTWISPDYRIGLASRRLAIFDLSDAGAQPMATADGQFRITFNGEIYNYRELRKKLERAFGSVVTPKCCFTSMPSAVRKWCTRCAVCTPLLFGTRGERICLLRVIHLELSCFIMQITMGYFGSLHKLRH